MPVIELKNIKKYILNGLNLTINDGEILALVGPNGSGKTTLLNIIAGLIDYEGEVFFDGKKMDGIPPHRRGVGYLFQDLALFPHMNVESNIAYGLKIRDYPEETIKKRVNELMNALHIERLRDRYPDNLSGGEKQRVAIARALAPFQKILLLDEPTSSLDSQTAKYFRSEIRSILKDMKITAIVVMHDLVGAEEIADRIAILYKGSIEQISKPEEILFHPKTEKVSEFIGMPNILYCDDSKILSTGLVQVRSGNMSIVLPYEGTNIKKIAIPPHDIYISNKKPPGPALNRFEAIVTDIIPVRSVVRIKVNINGNNLMAEMSKEAFDELDLYIGKKVYVIIKMRRLRFTE